MKIQMYSSHWLQFDLWMLSSWMGGEIKVLSSLYKVKIWHRESDHSHKAPFEVMIFYMCKNAYLGLRLTIISLTVLEMCFCAVSQNAEPAKTTKHSV